MNKRGYTGAASAVVIIMLLSSFLPAAVVADSNIKNTIKGYDKGVSWANVVPLKKIMFVNFDENSYLDDYAYLAAVPTTVFYDKTSGRLFSYPLLYYQDPYPVEEDKERSLNARQGIEYFMEDWMSYCNGELDGMTLINVPESKVKQWSSRNITTIKGSDPYSIASKIALHDWSYSDYAVVAVIKPEYEKPWMLTNGEKHGTLSPCEVTHKVLTVTLPDIGTAATWTPFEINDKVYKYMTAELKWPYKAIDYDLQVYDTQLGQVDNAMKDYKEHLMEGLREIVGSFIRHYGEWRVAVTAVPKKGVFSSDEKSNGFSITGFKELAETLKKQGEIHVTLYPGTMIKLPKTPFGCRDINLTLKWGNPNVRLGFTIVDPAETEICSTVTPAEIVSGENENLGNGEESLHIELLGETRDNENYSVCVFSIDSISTPIDFTLEYSWHEKYSKEEGDGFASAANGAVLASLLDAPLLYVDPSSMPMVTKDILYKLGVENIYLVNIGNHLKDDVRKELSKIARIEEYDTAGDTYNAIKEGAEENDVVFTTIDPWTYWYVTELKPAGEYHGALFIGPAAYIAAHHHTPVLIVDLHPRLSQAVTYHTHFWSSSYYRQHVDIPNSGNMALSSWQVYDFLRDHNLGELEKGKAAAQKQETIITVAGQYDIGIPWDRAFTGAGLNGRFMFSPVDTSYWIARNVFYPALIFQNPGMYKNKYWQGSESTTEGLGDSAFERIFNLFGRKKTFDLGLLNRLAPPLGSTLKITKPTREEEFQYPVLQTYDDYIYEFNAEASKHWNFKYERADGVTPGEEFSPDPIDDGIVKGKSGAYYPDLDETYTIPLYSERAGYGNVYSSSFDKIMENLNRGVLMWMVCAHGAHLQGGELKLWDPDSPYVVEENPWRVYETPLLYPGNLRELIKWFIYFAQGEKPSTLTNIMLPLHIMPHIGSTEHPDTLSINPQLRGINKLIKTLGIPYVDFWGATGIIIYRDRVLHPFKTLFRDKLPFIRVYEGDGKVIISPNSGSIYVCKWIPAFEFDDAMKNLHSCGVNAISCLPAGTYLHMTWVRHGVVYTIIDPWTTTDWSAVWQQMLIKLFAMGYTVGQAYERGMRAAGPEYVVGQFWWDRYQNVELFGDPDLRVFVPARDYSDTNHWEREDVQPLRWDGSSDLYVDGHMLFGATSYPHARQPPAITLIILAITIISILIVVGVTVVSIRGKKRKKEGKK